jgi:hypothetical protein
MKRSKEPPANAPATGGPIMDDIDRKLQEMYETLTPDGIRIPEPLLALSKATLRDDQFEKSWRLESVKRELDQYAAACRLMNKYWFAQLVIDRYRPRETRQSLDKHNPDSAGGAGVKRRRPKRNSKVAIETKKEHAN